MNNLEKAKKLLLEGGYTCVICGENGVDVTRLRGVKPLVEWIDEGKDFSGCSAADKVVGRAAALLYAFMNIKDVYSDVISESAIEVFRHYGIDFSAGEITPTIINRSGDDICPMEKLTKNVKSPLSALRKIRAKLENM